MSVAFCAQEEDAAAGLQRCGLCAFFASPKSWETRLGGSKSLV